MTTGVFSAPRRSGTGLRSARPVAMAYMKICPHICITRRGGFQSSPAFNDAKHGENFRGGDVGNWPVARASEGYAFRDGRARYRR